MTRLLFTLETGEPGKLREVFPVRNFGPVREIETRKYFKIIDKVTIKTVVS